MAPPTYVLTQYTKKTDFMCLSGAGGRIYVGQVGVSAWGRWACLRGACVRVCVGQVGVFVWGRWVYLNETGAHTGVGQVNEKGGRVSSAACDIMETLSVPYGEKG